MFWINKHIFQLLRSLEAQILKIFKLKSSYKHIFRFLTYLEVLAGVERWNFNPNFALLVNVFFYESANINHFVGLVECASDRTH